jgi:hypothetical protein
MCKKQGLKWARNKKNNIFIKKSGELWRNVGEND